MALWTSSTLCATYRTLALGIKTKVVVAYVTHASRQYDLAEKQFESLGDDWGLIWAYREKKMYPKAIAAWQRWKLSHPSQRRHPHCLATVAGIYGLEGRKREAQKLMIDGGWPPPIRNGIAMRNLKNSR